MTPATARLALVAGFPAFLAGEALAQAEPLRSPSAAEVGQALAVASSCSDLDGFTLCSPHQPTGAKFRELLCVEYGADLEHRPIVRCVYKGARMKISGFRGATTFQDWGDGAIDLIRIGNDWLPKQN